MRATTIVSQSTPVGNSAISVVRISGPEAFVFSKNLCHQTSCFEHMKAQYLPVFIKGKEKIDSAIFLPFFFSEILYRRRCYGNILPWQPQYCLNRD